MVKCQGKHADSQPASPRMPTTPRASTPKYSKDTNAIGEEVPYVLLLDSYLLYNLKKSKPASSYYRLFTSWLARWHIEPPPKSNARRWWIDKKNRRVALHFLLLYCESQLLAIFVLFAIVLIVAGIEGLAGAPLTADRAVSKAFSYALTGICWLLTFALPGALVGWMVRWAGETLCNW